MRTIRTKVQAFEDYPDYVDLVDLTELIARTLPDPIPDLARTVTHSTSRAIIGTGRYGRDDSASHGLSVWFPADRGTYVTFRRKYLALDFYRRHRGWVQFLDAFHD